MMKAVITALLASAAVAVAAPASAALVDYYISGDGTGTLNGTDWSGSFLITMVGDNSTVSGNVIDPLVSASVDVPGGGTATLSIATRLGLSAGGVIFFSRSGSGGLDLFDFNLSAADAAAFAFQPGYGPVTGTGVTALYQFVNVATSEGPLTFNTSGDVQFWSSGAGVIPEASTWAMMLAGFAGLAFAGVRASRRLTAEA